MFGKGTQVGEGALLMVQDVCVCHNCLENGAWTNSDIFWVCVVQRCQVIEIKKQTRYPSFDVEHIEALHLMNLENHVRIEETDCRDHRMASKEDGKPATKHASNDKVNQFECVCVCHVFILVQLCTIH